MSVLSSLAWGETTEVKLSGILRASPETKVALKKASWSSLDPLIRRWPQRWWSKEGGGWRKGRGLWHQRVLPLQQVIHYLPTLGLEGIPLFLDMDCDQLLLRIGHFARECPSYTGLPHPGARREGGGGGGGGGSREYGTSKCLKCNRWETYNYGTCVVQVWYKQVQVGTL